MNSPITVADALADELKHAGVVTVFGLPGGENVHVMDALRRAGIRYILVHHESSAVFMADVTARLTGKPGVCMTTLGPGAANAVAGLAHADLDRSPILIITPQIPDEHLPDETHQYIDIAEMYAPITKGSFKLRPRGARDTIRRALAKIWNGKPGPVHLQVTSDDAVKPAAKGSGKFRQAPPRQPGAQSLATARKILADSRRPVIAVGLGLEPERPYAALAGLAETLRAPVICTPKAKGGLPDDHPLAGGVIGLTRTDPAYEILDQADCIIAVGMDVVELVRTWEYAVPLIWISPWKNRGPVIKAAVELVGPMNRILEKLARFPSKTEKGWGEVRTAALREKLARQQLPVPTPGRMLPQQVLAAIRRAAPRDAVFTTDVGSHKILSCQTWPTFAPNSFFVSNGLSCMGFSLPAAIATSMLYPDRSVVCLIGDAGLLMAMGELGVLARSGGHVIVVVMNDGALDLIRAQQLKANHPVYGTEFTDPDFVRIAEAFGIRGVRVSDEERFAVNVTAALGRAGPTLIEALIDPVSYPTTPKS